MSLFDILVVGGGLLGRATAYELAKAGVSVGCIYERGETQGMASAAAGGMLGVFSEASSHDSIERRTLEVEQRWAARQLYSAWVDDLRQATGVDIFLQDGLFVIANGNGIEDAQEIAAIRAAAQQLGSPVETVPAHTIPGFKPQRYAYEAIYLSGEGSVDTHQLLNALDIALERHERVSIIDDRVTSLTLGTGGGEVTLGSGEKHSAAQVVLANGVEVSRLLHQSGLGDLGIPHIFSGRGVSLLLRTPHKLPVTVRTPNRGFACGLHVVPRADGALYLGATNRFSTTPDVDQLPTLGEVNTLLYGEGLHEIATELRSAEIVQIAVGHRPVTLDHLPLIGRTRDERILLATATYRNGVLLTPLAAKLIREEVLHSGTHAAHPFSPCREYKTTFSSELESWLFKASQNLYETLSEPGGWLPNGRDQDLQDYFFVTMNLLLNPNYDREALMQQVNRLLQRAPMDETIPLLFDMISRYGHAHKN